MNNLVWQIPAAWAALGPLLMATFLVRMGIRNHLTARRVEREMADRFGDDRPAVPSARRSLLVFYSAVWVLTLAVTVLSFWCIFW